MPLHHAPASDPRVLDNAPVLTEARRDLAAWLAKWSGKYSKLRAFKQLRFFGAKFGAE